MHDINSKIEADIQNLNKLGGSKSKAHQYLLYHAAFPLALTPDLLYEMWRNFPCDCAGKFLDVPWIAVADILLSNFCRRCGTNDDLFEISKENRKVLLQKLRYDESLSQRFQELNHFLLEYIKKNTLFLPEEKREKQKWICLAYLKPDSVVEELQEKFRQLQKHTSISDIVSMASLIDELEEPLTEHEHQKFLEYCQIQLGELTCKKLESIDSLLLHNMKDPDLWRERSQITKELGNFKSAIVSELTGIILLDDQNILIRTVEENKKELELNKLESFDIALVPTQIEEISYCAEVNYILNIYFANKYHNEQLLTPAINKMRVGDETPSYSYFRFPDYNTPDRELDYTEIIQNRCTHFLEYLQIGKCKKTISAIITKQFSIIMEKQLGKSLLSLEYPSEGEFSDVELHLWRKLSDVERSNKIESFLETESIWQTTLINGLNKNIQEFLFQSEHRPIFPDHENLMRKAEKIYEHYQANLSWEYSLEQRDYGLDNAETQRKLLYIVTKYGPVEAFEAYISEFEFNSFASLAFSIIINCDIFLLNLSYNKPVNKNDFFTQIINILPDDGCSLDFYDGMRQVIFCLNSSEFPAKSEFFYACLTKILIWLERFDTSLNDLYELLNLIAWLQIGLLQAPNLYAKPRSDFHTLKKKLWMAHADYLQRNEWKFF